MAPLFKHRDAAELVLPPGGFVDIHCHPLPGVDDGAQSWEDALAMLERAAAGGTTVIVATPHGDGRAKWDNVGVLRERHQRLSQELERRGIRLTVVLGMETPLEPNTVQRLEQGSALTLNGSACVLVELPPNQLPLYWENVLFQLQLKGKRPIIAHPERQMQIQQKPELLQGPVDRGVLVQVTAASLAGRMGQSAKKTAEKLLRAGLAHVLASDAHAHEGPRGPDLLEGYGAAVRLVGQEKAAEMTATLPRELVLGHRSPTEP